MCHGRWAVKGWQFRRLRTRAASLRRCSATCSVAWSTDVASTSGPWLNPYPPLTAEIWNSAVLESGARAAICDCLALVLTALYSSLQEVPC